MTKRERLAWLAGLLDGEGSIGIYQQRLSTQKTHVYAPKLQMSITCGTTCEKAIEILREDIGVSAYGYFYREKIPERHKPSHYLRVGRMADVLKVCEVLAPLSTTKKEQYGIVAEFCRRRLDGVTLTAEGKIAVGGHHHRPYTKEEDELVKRARQGTRRGV